MKVQTVLYLHLFVDLAWQNTSIYKL